MHVEPGRAVCGVRGKRGKRGYQPREGTRSYVGNIVLLCDWLNVFLSLDSIVDSPTRFSFTSEQDVRAFRSLYVFVSSVFYQFFLFVMRLACRYLAEPIPTYIIFV